MSGGVQGGVEVDHDGHDGQRLEYPGVCFCCAAPVTPPQPPPYCAACTRHIRLERWKGKLEFAGYLAGATLAFFGVRLVYPVVSRAGHSIAVAVVAAASLAAVSFLLRPRPGHVREVFHRPRSTLFANAAVGKIVAERNARPWRAAPVPSEPRTVRSLAIALVIAGLIPGGATALWYPKWHVTLHVDNGERIPIELRANGSVVVRVEAGSRAAVPLPMKTLRLEAVLADGTIIDSARFDGARKGVSHWLFNVGGRHCYQERWVHYSNVFSGRGTPPSAPTPLAREDGGGNLYAIHADYFGEAPGAIEGTSGAARSVVERVGCAADPQNTCRLVVDNGLAETITVELGGKRTPVAARDHVTVTAPPGQVGFRALTQSGEVLDQVSLELSPALVVVYNPGAAWDYVVRERSYGSALVMNEGTPDRPIRGAVLFGVPAVDYLLQPFPEKIQVKSDGSPLALTLTHETRTALLHQPDEPRAKRPVRAGRLRLVELAPLDLLLLPGEEPRTGLDQTSELWIDNAYGETLALAVDGAPLAQVPAGGFVHARLRAGSYQVEAQAGPASDRATLAIAPGERWVWAPGGRREYSLERQTYSQYSFLGDPGKPPAPRRARALGPFRSKATFVFDAPSSIAVGELTMATTHDLLVRGAAGDHRRAVRRSIEALRGKGDAALDAWRSRVLADPATLSDCHVFAARAYLADREGNRGLEEAQRWRVQAAAWDCHVTGP